LTNPLEGIAVVDFTQVMLGPCATQLLGDFGADVIKIERLGAGDLSRHSYADETGLDNPVFLSLNRNKRSVEIDVRSEQGYEAVRRLLREADVLVHNFRPGVMERMRLGYDAVRELNPRIVYAEGTGFGTTGPYAHKGGQDVIAQAFTGVMWQRADPELPLSIYPTTMGDFSAGMHLVQGILLALLARERTGEGQRVEVSLYDSLIAAQMQEATVRLMRDANLNWAAMPLSGVFETTDGAVVIVGAFKENPLRDISMALELDEDLSGRPEFSTLEQQRLHKHELHAIFRERFASQPTDYWITRLEEQDLLCGPVRPLAEALADAQTAENGMLLEFEHPVAGVVRTVSAPVHLTRTPAALHRRPPLLGEHTEEVLTALGYDREQLQQLRKHRIIAAPETEPV
jgi:formyl-CoA transferase